MLHRRRQSLQVGLLEQGAARASSDPSWLVPSLGQSAAGQASVQRSSSSQQLADWLNPPVCQASVLSSSSLQQLVDWLHSAAGSASAQIPSARRHQSLLKQEQLDWLQPSAGRASIGGHLQNDGVLKGLSQIGAILLLGLKHLAVSVPRPMAMRAWSVPCPLATLGCAAYILIW